MKTNIALSVENLTKHYGDKLILNDVNFNVLEGQFHAFVGDNGAGKTTTIKCILGLIKQYSGEIKSFENSNIDPSFREKIGYVPEVAGFLPNLSLQNYLLQMASLLGIPKKEAKNKIDYFAEKFNIVNLLKTKPKKFSSGQKKKVLLIQSLLSEPRLLILDEPTANLDPSTRREFFEILQKLHKDGMTILIITHVLDEIENIIDSLTILKKGEVIYSGEMKWLKQNRKSRARIKFLNIRDKTKSLLILQKNNYVAIIEEDELFVEIEDESNILEISNILFTNKVRYLSIEIDIIKLANIFSEFQKDK